MCWSSRAGWLHVGRGRQALGAPGASQRSMPGLQELPDGMLGFTGILCRPLQKLTLRHLNSNQCLAEPSEEDRLVPTMRECGPGRAQQWLLRNMTLAA